MIAAVNSYIQLKQEKTLKIAIYVWDAYNISGIVHALKNKGIQLIYVHDINDFIMESDELKQADVIWSVNYFKEIAIYAHDFKKLYIAYNCDAYLLSMFDESIFFDTNLIFSFDKTDVEYLKKIGVNNAYYMSLGFDMQMLDVLKSVSVDNQMSGIEKNTISFVGGLYEHNAYDRVSQKLPEYIRGYLDGIINAQMHVGEGNIIDSMLTTQCCLMLEKYIDYEKEDTSFAGIKELFATTVLGYKVAQLVRKRNINILSKFIFNEKKEKLVNYYGDENAFFPFANIYARVDYRTQMPEIFNKSAININMTIPNIRNGIPQRVWDIAGCGGFILSDYRFAMQEIFEPEKDIVYYEDEEELKEKALYYINHETQRKRIAINASEKVRKDYTYDAMTDKILKLVN